MFATRNGERYHCEESLLMLSTHKKTSGEEKMERETKGIPLCDATQELN